MMEEIKKIMRKDTRAEERGRRYFVMCSGNNDNG